MPPWGRGWGWAQFDPDHVECEGRSRGDKLLLEEVGWTLKRNQQASVVAAILLQQEPVQETVAILCPVWVLLRSPQQNWRPLYLGDSCLLYLGRRWEHQSRAHGKWWGHTIVTKGSSQIANSRKGLSRTGGGSWHQRAKGRQQHPYHGRVGVAEATGEMVPTLYRFSNYSQSETQFWMCHSHSSHRRLNYSSDFSITLRIMRDPKHNLQSPHPMI